jgi:hypothetical protein
VNYEGAISRANRSSIDDCSHRALTTQAQKGPVFTKEGNLVLPTGFREWVFFGGPITPNGLNNGKAL